MRALVRTASVFALLVISACATVAPETVKLSSAEGQDLLALKKSHDFYLNQYYDRVEADANRAIDTQYTPALISTALSGKSGAMLTQQLQAGKSGGAAATKAIEFMEHFVADVERNVAAERQKFIAPMEEARHSALGNIDTAYANLSGANATITAYLESLNKLHEADNELLAKVGLPDLQDKAASEIANVSNDIGSIDSKAQSGQETLEQLKSKIEALEKSVGGSK